MKKYFALIFICLIILASTAASSFCAPCNPALIPAEADFAIQISFCETHKKTLNQIVTKIFDDKNAGREVPDLIDIFGDEFGKFFLKASFETILKDLKSLRSLDIRLMKKLIRQKLFYSHLKTKSVRKCCSNFEKTC